MASRIVFGKRFATSCSPPGRVSTRAGLKIKLALLVIVMLVIACETTPKSKQQSKPDARTTPTQEPSDPVQLYLPDLEHSEHEPVMDVRDGSNHQTHDVTLNGPGLARRATTSACPPEMVYVAGLFCIDRFESSLVDSKKLRKLSPHFPPSQQHTFSLFERWSNRAPRSGRSYGRKLPIPEPPPFQLTEKYSPLAQSIAGVLPAGYLNRALAKSACENAKKRLCGRGEWEQACRGERDTKFPYGEKYRDGVCNIHRKSHPASIIHGNASHHHLDPRLGLAEDDDGPLLNPTGMQSQCISTWGEDGIYDMVGNIDEWIEDPNGAFLGGFFSRATRSGCEASIDSHSPGYLDYSLGTRCCSDPSL